MFSGKEGGNLKKDIRIQLESDYLPAILNTAIHPWVPEDDFLR